MNIYNLPTLFPFIIIAILAPVVFFIAWPLQRKKKARQFIELFKTQFKYPFGPFLFKVDDHHFELSFQSKGSSPNTLAGSLMILAVKSKAHPLTLLGHPECSAFTTGKFISMPPSKKIQIKNQSFLLASEDDQFAKQLELKLSPDLIFADKLGSCLSEEFNYFAFNHRTTLGLGGVKRQYSIEYYVLDKARLLERDQILKLVEVLQVLNSSQFN